MTTRTVQAEATIGDATTAAEAAKRHSEWSEESRRLHPEVIEALDAAGAFRMRRPQRFGGTESGPAQVQEMIRTVSAADGSAGWTLSAWLVSSWIASQFADPAQEEVFSDPSVRICSVLSPTGGGQPTAGGMKVSGEWHFVSGAHHSGWQVVMFMAPAPAGSPLPEGAQWPVLGLVPMDDLERVDDWHAAGLRGTGSITTRADNLTVPEHRLLPLVPLLQGASASEANRGSAVFSTPMVPTGSVGFSAVAHGLAERAMEEFLGRLPGRGITYTDYESQAQAPVTHSQVGEAFVLIDEVAHHAQAIAGACADTDTQWDTEARVTVRGRLGRAFDLAQQAVTLLAGASGGSSIYLKAPIQRVERDTRALAQHALMNATTNRELLGRTLCGLEPNTQYL